MAPTLFFLPALVLALSVQGSPLLQRYTHTLKETFHPPTQWVQQQPAPPDHTFMLRINLVQPNFKTLEENLYAVSDPEGPRYGMHLSKSQVDQLAAPDPGGARAVDNWLTSHGFDANSFIRSSSLDSVKVKTTVQKAEEMLNTIYHVWENKETGESLVRTTSWSVPDYLDAHVDLVHPTTAFMGTRPPRTMLRWSNKAPGRAAVVSIPTTSPSAVDPSCSQTITPTCLLQLYNATDYVVQSAGKGNKIAITSYSDQFANTADLNSFYQALRPDAVNSSFTVVSVNGGENNQALSEAGYEAGLDAQYAFGMTFPTPAVVFTTSGNPTHLNEPYLDWLDFVLSQDDLPQTISTSYGGAEHIVPLSLAKTACNGFAQLGARGVSLTFSSGDGGVGDGDPDPATTQCPTINGTNVRPFVPGFPAGCPYVTSVGGTVDVPEKALDLSGGGFSNYFPRPSYQDAAVKPYLGALGNTYQGLFNPDGRAHPDVAAQADNYEIWLQGEPMIIGGTSASSPTFAGIISLLNDARIAAGKPPLGFLNPLIYSKGSRAFNDITVGNNPGCGTPGFNASKGWDAVTGFGTPNFGMLKDVVLST